MMNVSNSNTTLTLTALSLTDSVFSGTVVGVVTAIRRYGIGQDSDSVIAIITD